MMYIDLLYNDNVIGTAEYIYFEGAPEYDQLYLHLFKVIKPMVIAGGSTIRLEIKLDKDAQKREVYADDFAILYDLAIDNSACLLIEAKVDFYPKEYFPEYDQGVVDIFYAWDKEETYLLRFNKHQISYCLACMLYYGVPSDIISNKYVVVDCSAIVTKYGFYTTLAELLMGYKAYIGINLDAFRDCLKHMTFNEVTIGFKDFERLQAIFGEDNADYILQELNENKVQTIMIA